MPSTIVNTISITPLPDQTVPPFLRLVAIEVKAPNPPHPSLPFPRSFSIGALTPQRTAIQDATIIPTTNKKMITSPNC
jgi:hypothetical protein